MSGSGSVSGGGEFIPEPVRDLRSSGDAPGSFGTVRSLSSLSSYSSISSDGHSAFGSNGSRARKVSYGESDRESGYHEGPERRGRSGTFPLRGSSVSGSDRTPLPPRASADDVPTALPRTARSGSFRDGLPDDGIQADAYGVLAGRFGSPPAAPRYASSSGSRDDERHNSGAPRRWKRGALLGAGAFGQVYKAMDLDTGIVLAVKQVDLTPEGDNSNVKELQSLEAEIALLRNLHHERIVMYYGTERSEQKLCIFMEYVAGVRHRGPWPPGTPSRVGVSPSLLYLAAPDSWPVVRRPSQLRPACARAL